MDTDRRAVVFTNVRIFDGSGAPPFPGEVRVEGQRIAAVSSGDSHLPREGARLQAGRSAARRTALGGEIMGRPHELGRVKPGYLADLLLVDGDPTRDVALLQDKQQLTAIMKDGRFHKAPALAS